jgi:hypothetical protein
MVAVIIECPDIGFSKTVEADEAAFKKLSQLQKSASCPFCSRAHPWWHYEPSGRLQDQEEAIKDVAKALKFACKP